MVEFNGKISVSSGKKSGFSPIWCFLIIIISVFIAETFVMFFLTFISPAALAPLLWRMAFLDAALLSITLFPLIYYFGFSPLLSHIRERKKAETALEESNNFLKTVIESLTYPFFVLDVNDYTVKMANSATFSGFFPEGMTCYFLSHHQDKPCSAEHICPLEEVRRTKKPAVVEHIHYDKDGNLKNVEVHAYPIIDKEGGVVQLIEYYLDITERRKAEEALRESEEKYRVLVEAANDAIFLIDYETEVIISANRKAEELIGRPREELIGYKQDSLYPKEETVFYRRYLMETLKRRSSCMMVAFVSCKDGRKVPVNISTSVIELKGRKVFLSIFSDITALKKLEDTLRRDKDGLEKVVNETSRKLSVIQEEIRDVRRLSDIGALAATIAHELRNPLGVIRIAAYNIKKETDKPDIQGHIANIEKKIAESDQIIKNLLSYSRINAPNYEKVKVLSVLSDSIGHCQEKYNKWNVTIERDYNCSEDFIMEADPLHLSELFSNIMDNAFQAFTGKSGMVKISVNCDEAVNRGFFVFQDSGDGIDEADMEKIFEPFFTRKAKGIGLGLTVCKQVVNLHKGIIEIRSQRGKGTTVSVTLPIKQR